MGSGSSSKIWLALGASLAVSGGFAIIVSLPDGGLVMWGGVGLVSAGSLALRIGLGKSREFGTGAPLESSKTAAPIAQSSVEPELLRPTPRTVEMTSRGKTVIATWMLALAAFGTVANQHFGRLPPPKSESLLEQEGATSTATVHAREARQLEDDRTLYFVGYNFVTATGSPVRISRSVPERMYNRFAEGSTTRVVYFPGNPDNHYLPEITSPVSTRFVFFAGGILLAAAGFAEAQRRLHRRLVATGTAVSGFTADVRRRGGVRSFHVNYDVAGERRSIRARERNPSLRSGQSATVLFDPAISSRAVIYRLALYRVRG